MSEDQVREPGAEWVITPRPVDRRANVAQGEVHPITMSAIRALARRIVEGFQPEKIILFGSYAYGQPRPDSDVDLLVIMETTLRSRQQRLEISRALSPRPFPLDIVVRTPEEVAQRLALGDAFLDEIISHGRVLYERNRG
jgi:uncharacterized protein